MQRLFYKDSGLTRQEFLLLKSLTTPIKIQEYLDSLPMNWEKEGETCHSPREVLEHGKAHCIEGALFAATALWIQGEPPLVMNLSPRMKRGDVDHVVALYKRGDRYGAISKTNHAVIRFRDPVYRSLRELAMSYFHEWFLDSTGEKLLECYSTPLHMNRFGTNWITQEGSGWRIADALSVATHYYLVPSGNWRHVRKADAMERKAGALIEWKRDDPGT